MKQGYKQVIENGKLHIFETGLLVATGSYDAETGLLKIDEDLTESANYVQTTMSANYKTIHEQMGHPSAKRIKKTILATDGIVLTDSNVVDCEVCALTKTRKTNTRKQGRIPNHYLEVIESDTQGPFPITASDGTRNNLKFVDKKSRYVKMETIVNREAKTILSAFKRFKARMENITGNTVKNVRTDQGTEYLVENFCTTWLNMVL